MENTWDQIWKNRDIPKLSERSKFSQIELIELNGFDHPGILDLTKWINWFERLKKKEYLNCNSVYEIGCGSGAFLNYFSDLKVGGCDLSPNLIEIAKIQFRNADLSVASTEDFSTKIKYDNCSSFSVFQYLKKHDAWNTLEKMMEKSNLSFYVFDIPMESIQERCESFRKEKGMKESFHTYYSPDFFIRFAYFYGLEVKFQMQCIPGYMHNDYRFNVYFYKNI